jgi:hypothetical protein
MGWRPMSEAPREPCGVLFYVPAERIEGDILTDGWDYSFQIGYWDGVRFLEQGTGHEINERLESWGGCGNMPTHYQLLERPAQPKDSG